MTALLSGVYIKAPDFLKLPLQDQSLSMAGSWTPPRVAETCMTWTYYMLAQRLEGVGPDYCSQNYKPDRNIRTRIIAMKGQSPRVW